MGSDYRRHVGRRVIVQLPAHTLDGTLCAEGKATLTLDHAAVLAEDGGGRPIDGLVVIERQQVAWVQVP